MNLILLGAPGVIRYDLLLIYINAFQRIYRLFFLLFIFRFFFRKIQILYITLIQFQESETKYNKEDQIF